MRRERTVGSRLMVRRERRRVRRRREMERSEKSWSKDRKGSEEGGGKGVCQCCEEGERGGGGTNVEVEEGVDGRLRVHREPGPSRVEGSVGREEGRKPDE